LTALVDGKSNVLSVRNFDSSSTKDIDIRHYRVRSPADVDTGSFYVVKANTFSTINELIDYYQRTYYHPHSHYILRES